MKRIWIVLLCASNVVAQDAPSKFWDRQRIARESVAYGLAATDIANTCYSLKVLGGHEQWAPTQSCAGVAAWIAAGQVSQTAMSYWAYKHGHMRLSRAIPWVSTSGSGVAIGYSLAHR